MSILKEIENTIKRNQGKRGLYYFSLKPYGFFFEPSPKHRKFDEKNKSNLEENQ